MLRKFLVTGFFLLSAIALSVTDAHAQFAGWGWFGFSSVSGEILTEHTPNPTGRPSAIAVAVSATIQIACVNPASNGIFNGKAFKNTLSAISQIGGQSSIVNWDTGEATTTVTLSLNSFDNTDGLHPEASKYCTNPNWAPIPNSAMVLDFSGSVKWCLLDDNGNLKCSRTGTLDSDSITCVLDPQAQRDATNGTAPHPAAFICTEPQS
jgi:hypothetical protein